MSAAASGKSASDSANVGTRSSAASDLVGRRLGPYDLRHRLAEGGMAAVYLAQRRSIESFHKWLAVKVVHPHLATDERFIQMFLDEARLAARIEHPNVCAVYDFGKADDAYYLAMEYLHGDSLSTVLAHAWRGDGLPCEIMAAVIADAARGLHAAHELRLPNGERAEVVHRDVSPQNIFVRYDGVAKVVDFGVARSRERLAERTSTGEVKGKLAYMAPEQLQRQPVDRRVDVFALGIVLWESTLGRRLFKRDNEGATVYAVVHDEIPAPSRFDAKYPTELERIVLRALQRNVEDRYPTAEAMARDLEAFVASTGRPAGPSELSRRLHLLLEDRIRERDELLRQLEQSPLPASSVASSVENETSHARRIDPTVASEPGTWITGARPASRASRWAAATLGLIAVAAVGAFLVQRASSRGAAPHAPTAVTTQTTATTPATPATPVAALAPAVEPPSSPTTSVPASDASVPDTSQRSSARVVERRRTHRPSVDAPSGGVGISRSYDAFRRR